MTDRVVLADTPFRAVFFWHDLDVSDLILKIYNSEDVLIDQVKPVQSTITKGIYYSSIFLSKGEYVLSWESASAGIGVRQILHAISGNVKTQWAAGDVYKFNYDGETGKTVTLRIFQPINYEELIGSPFQTAEEFPGTYLSESVAVTKTGEYVLGWYVNGEYVGFDVIDVYQSPVRRVVTAGFNDRFGDPYKGLNVAFVRSNGTFTEHAITDKNGVVTLALPEGDYFVCVYDVSKPGRTFTRNNFEWEVVDPTTRPSGNTVVWTLDWLDVEFRSWIQLPSDRRAIMKINMLSGPSGKPASYKSFTVKQTTSYRYNDTFVSPGIYEGRLDMNGSASVPLIRKTSVVVTFSDPAASVAFVVPDEPEFSLASVVGSDLFTITTPGYTYPVRVS